MTEATIAPPGKLWFCYPSDPLRSGPEHLSSAGSVVPRQFSASLTPNPTSSSRTPSSQQWHGRQCHPCILPKFYLKLLLRYNISDLDLSSCTSQPPIVLHTSVIYTSRSFPITLRSGSSSRAILCTNKTRAARFAHLSCKIHTRRQNALIYIYPPS
jgi:hypothetical protein